MQYYQIKDGALIDTSEQDSNFQIIQPVHSEQYLQFIEAHQLPEDIFDWEEYPEIAPRMETIDHPEWGQTLIIIFTHIHNLQDDLPIGERIEPVTYIWSQNKLYCISKNYPIIEALKNLDHSSDHLNLESLILYSALSIYQGYTKELAHIKSRIDGLESFYEKQGQAQALKELAMIEQDIITLERILDLQKSTLQKLFDDDYFMQWIDNKNLIYDLQLYNRQVNNLVHLYRDIVDSTSSLFSDIMSNRLNDLMKFLNSFSVILAVGSLVGSLWGINTPNLPADNHQLGSMIIFALAAVVMIVTGLYLRNKEI